MVNPACRVGQSMRQGANGPTSDLACVRIGKDPEMRAWHIPSSPAVQDLSHRSETIGLRTARPRKSNVSTQA